MTIGEDSNCLFLGFGGTYVCTHKHTHIHRLYSSHSQSDSYWKFLLDQMLQQVIVAADIRMPREWGKDGWEEDQLVTMTAARGG